MIPDILTEAELKMDSAVEHAKEDFAAIRTGRAHPAMFAKLTADYYGAQTPLAAAGQLPGAGRPDGPDLPVRQVVDDRDREVDP